MDNNFKLGFGLMRLPRLENGQFDVEQVKKMVDMFIEAGGTYFDTAFVYEGSEEVAKTALVERHPRESYTLATKMCSWHNCRDKESAKVQFDTSLSRTGAGYFDYYLLHAMQESNYKAYEEYKMWDLVRELKEEGLVRNYGFSFHSGPELLDKILTEHSDVDFVQLQLNYADWENPDVASRANYEVARRHGKKIVVMEPVKGGALANPVPEVAEILKAADPDASFASWAIRYVASLDGILSVLSGMSNIEQMADNLSYMKDFKPLSDAERETIHKAQAALNSVNSIPCTACRYCVEGCPMNIPIPDIFAARNQQLIYNNFEKGGDMYAAATDGCGKASDCIECMQCESVCPQQIEITKHLKECVKVFE